MYEWAHNIAHNTLTTNLSHLTNLNKADMASPKTLDEVGCMKKGAVDYEAIAESSMATHFIDAKPDNKML